MRHNKRERKREKQRAEAFNHSTRLRSKVEEIAVNLEGKKQVMWGGGDFNEIKQ